MNFLKIKKGKFVPRHQFVENRGTSCNQQFEAILVEHNNLNRHRYRQLKGEASLF